MIPRILLILLLLSSLSILGHSEVTFFGFPVEGTETPPSSSAPVAPTNPEQNPQPIPASQAPPSASATGPRILIIFDVSMTVVKKASETNFPMEKIKQEALNLVEKLPDNVSVGVIQFARNYKTFRENLVQLTPENRKAVGQWIEREWVDTGSMPPSSSVKANNRAVIGVLELAAKMQPDVIYMISDGSFQWSAGGKSETVPWKEVSTAVEAIKNGSKPTVFNFIGFQMDSGDKRALSSIVQDSGGKMNQIAKK